MNPFQKVHFSWFLRSQITRTLVVGASRWQSDGRWMPTVTDCCRVESLTERRHSGVSGSINNSEASQTLISLETSGAPTERGQAAGTPAWRPFTNQVRQMGWLRHIPWRLAPHAIKEAFSVHESSPELHLSAALRLTTAASWGPLHHASCFWTSLFTAVHTHTDWLDVTRQKKHTNLSENKGKHELNITLFSTFWEWSQRLTIS